MSLTSPSSPSPYGYSDQNDKLIEIKEPTITKIEVSEKDLAELKKVLNSKHITSWGKLAKQRRLVGLCSGGCGDIPDYLVTRYYEGATALERYCSKCMDDQNNGITEQQDTEILTKVQKVESTKNVEVTNISNNQKE